MFKRCQCVSDISFSEHQQIMENMLNNEDELVRLREENILLREQLANVKQNCANIKQQSSERFFEAKKKKSLMNKQPVRGHTPECMD